MDAAFGEPVRLLPIQGSQDLAIENEGLEIRGIAAYGVQNYVAKPFPPAGPIAVSQFVRSVLHGDGHDVLPVGSQALDRVGWEWSRQGVDWEKYAHIWPHHTPVPNILNSG